MRLPATRLLTLCGVLVLAASACGGAAAGGEDTVRVYSARHYDLEPAFEKFAAETGISVDFLYGTDAGLRERIKAEGEDTLADVYMTVDAGNLYLAAKQGIFRPIDSQKLRKAIPAHLRHPKGLWFGLSKRARTIVYNPAEVDPSQLSTYAALAKPKWKGRLCLRRSTNVYTQSLVAALIAHHGHDRALEIVSGWAGNAEILNNDIVIMENIAAGECDVGIVNHYYLARILEDNPDFPVKIFWANQKTWGTHVNISGAGVTKYADNPELAKKLIVWLATSGQKEFVYGNHEYPVNPYVEPDPLVADFGEFKADKLNAATLGRLNEEAIKLMAEAGYE